ncbi:SDR family NAD(P)-dependent oxidoreductase [Saccharibacillus sacchari]|uniref:SDR family NAD(P)-dependent oxidoreductase n=1 Tax=Saccharibacillus sacchari TaxID=456493 RepID=A0ACC6PHR4_9BACL
MEHYSEEFMQHANILVEEFSHSKQNDSGSPVNVENMEEGIKESPRVTSKQRLNEDEIAIVGLNGRYPMSEDLYEFWDNLVAGRNCVTEIPPTRWDHTEHYDVDKTAKGKSYAKYGGFISHPDKFDPRFFNISTREANLMDPQERIFLETAWNTFEDAGYTEEALKEETVGVFVGAMYGQYQLYGMEQAAMNKSIPNSVFSSIANRVSYFFDLNGPSMALDTMCSSSLTAIHLACNSIRKGESTIALAGGVNLTIHPNKYILLSQGKFLSTGKECRSFGKGGDGFIPGEGVGAVLLKPLHKALQDKDQIYAIVKSSAINHGGRTHGYSVPNPQLQAEIIKSAMEKANVSAESISYIEAHGTGTSLGDPIEVAGLRKAFGEVSESMDCRLGSVKSNIGHAESASGIAGLTKVLLQMKYKKLVPSLHAEEINPDVVLENSGIQIQRELEDWQGRILQPDENLMGRRAGLSSFGAGGSNAHIIVEEYLTSDVEQEKNFNAKQDMLFIFSARSEISLKRYLEKMVALLNRDDHPPLLNIAYTLQVGRQEMENRVVFLASDKLQLIDKLNAYLSSSDETTHYAGKANTSPSSERLIKENVLQAVNDKNYDLLARCWVEGEVIPWNELYSFTDGVTKVSLPTYSFDRKRHWIKQGEDVELNVRQQPTALRTTWSKDSDKDQEPSVPLAYFVPSWRETPYAKRDLEWSNQNIVCIYPDKAREWADSLERLLMPENKFYRICIDREGLGKRENEWNLVSPSIQAYKEAFKQLKKPDIIIHLGGIVNEVKNASNSFIVEKSQEYSLFSTFRLVKAASELGWTMHFTRVMIVTSGTQAVNKGDMVNPTHAGLNGFARSLSKEYPEWKVSTLDIPNPSSSKEPTRFCDIWAERLLKAAAVEELEEIALRENSIFIKEIIPAPIETENVIKDVPFRQGGTYLILGGAGGIGIAISRYLAESLQAKLIWLGRSTINNSIREKMNLIEDLGGEVLYIQADATDENEVKKAIHTAKIRFGNINGVIHSALVLKDRLIEFMSEVELKEVLTPKMAGSIALYQAIKNEKLDFMVFFSSAQSFSGNLGQSNYAAACTYKDAFAYYLRREKGIPAQIVNWGYWGEVGIVSSEEYNRKLAQQGLFSIHSEEGTQAFKNILLSGYEQVMAIKASSQLLQSIGVKPQGGIEFDSSIDSAYVRKLRAGMNELNDLSVTLLARELISSGLFAKGETLYTKEEIKKSLGLKSNFNQLFDELLSILCRYGFMYLNSNQYGRTEKLKMLPKKDSLEKSVASFIIDYPEMKDYIELVRICLNSYLELLSGQIPVAEVLFPNGSMERVKGIYRGNRTSTFFNESMLYQLIPYIESRKEKLLPGEKIRILEVGAGTGGTSTSVLRGLLHYRDVVEYTYTDISLAFIQHGKREFSEKYPFTKYKILNVEKNPSEQGFSNGSYDVILATNVLHATKNMTNTVTNIQKMLSDEGLLIVNEGTEKQEFLTLTFGLLEGWWLFEDAALRIEGSPLLSSEKWCLLLNESGFEINEVVGAEKFAQVDTGQNVIVAKKEKNSSHATEIIQFENSEYAPASRNQKDDFVQNVIIESLSEALEAESEEFNDEHAFKDFGVDSIIAVEVVNLINTRLKITLKSTDLFNYPSISELKTYIQNKFGKDIYVLESSSKMQTNEKDAPKVDEVNEDCFDIAVIGMSAQFPGAKNVNEYWSNLKNGNCSVSEIDRWPIDSFYDESSETVGKSYSKHAGLMLGVDEFDPMFFNISPAEAELMDPRQRLFLEESWKAVEDAGYSMKQMSGERCGVYVGTGTGDYQNLMHGHSECLDSYAFMGNSNAILASRISYYLNLKGPSLAVDTACSSSVVAIHLACDSIRNGTCDMALAGGAEVLATPQFHVLASKSGMLSRDGQCHTFDQKANGFVPGEGVGVLLLKPLSQALQDRDHIYGIIAGSAINQDGKTNGITAPSTPSQIEVECEVYDKFNIDPESIDYIEAHGTATKLGDPIELDALTESFSRYTSKKNYCAIGSVKTNIGHTLAAAGIAGLIKVLLSIKHKQLVPTLNFKNNNPLIDFENSPFYVNTELRSWIKEEEKPRRAALNAFGFSGTNVHMVVEENIKNEERTNHLKQPQLILLSAKTEGSLSHKVQDLLDWLQCESEEPILEDLSYTLNMGRDHFTHRLAFVADDISDLIQLLETSQQHHFLNGGYVFKSQGGVKSNESLRLEGERILTELQHINDPLKKKQQLSLIADLYVEGCDLRWLELYKADLPFRLSLPTYPFEKDSYWFKPQASENEHMMDSKQLHPLLDYNLSTLHQQKYKKSFKGHEFFLEDHVIFGKKTLPGVAYLEMMREAAFLATNQKISVLRNTVWMSPIIIEHDPRDIYISIHSGRNNMLDCKVYSETENGQQEIHFQGKAQIDQGEVKEARYVNIEQINQSCTKSYLSGDELYTFIAQKGLELGERFKAIKYVKGNDREALSKLEIPTSVMDSLHSFTLQPTLLDAALLSIAGIQTVAGKDKLYIPYSMGEVEILGNLTSKGYAYVELSNPLDAIDFEYSSFHIAITDEEGKVVIQMKNFLGKIVDKNLMQSKRKANRDQQLLELFDEIYSGKLDEEAIQSMIGAYKL